MTGRIAFTAAALALTLPMAASAAPAKDSAPAPAVPDKQAAQLLTNCDAHKFETVVHEVVDGHPQASNVKLCGKDGQTDAEWIGTLKDAISKLNANKDMPAPIRDQIVTALRTEIARLENPAPQLPRNRTASTSGVDGLVPLPPLPQGRTAQASSLPPPRQIAPAAPSDDYASLPALPTAPPPPVQVLSGTAAASLPLLPRPRMTLTCYTPGEAEGPCTGFTRDTQVTVHAGEDLPAGTSLRFVRDGNPKADVDLAQLRKGRSARFNVPDDVCRHAVGGKLELRIVRSGQEVGTEGPYNLSC